MATTSAQNLMNTQWVAVGVLHILAGHANVSFPGSTRAHPSLIVMVNLGVGGPIQESWRKSFPFQVPGDLWQTIVVPVIELLKVQGGYTALLSRTGNLTAALNVITLMLNGVLPGSIPADEAVVAEEPPAPTVPSNPDTWPDGRLRLTYPVVD